MYKFFLKRVIDFLIALTGLILLSPVFIVVTILLYFANQGKPFFIQARPGLHEKIFNIIKFKTMNDKKDREGNYLPDSERLTAIGSFIRQTSLDELPQLINVLKGDMAIIGPRPLLPQYLSLYSESQKRRHNIRPGITGWAQVNGRNAISWTKKFELDVWYVDNLSFATDCKVIFLTVKKVVKKEGINQAEQATVEAFKGNN
ncbi:UDP-galactose phosphate transferase [Chryseobacterium sp. FH2]|uniref:sugar transferase n=1 Tax=Chryseobacterium sp. FH2 TaxID=1674291 RepID=UPI00065AF0EB|nr:sugar transferase [Chryseobacterium sp. FH2]KMQ68965.1 UDP-galactose phosphate transferase [Chryseobacterium sp. FH2]